MGAASLADRIPGLLAGRRIFIKCGPTDGRAGVNMLAAVAMTCDYGAFMSGAAFAFCSKNRKSIRILIWEDRSFWTVEKRKVSGTFRWPESKGDKASVELAAQVLRRMLQGMEKQQ